MEIVGSSGRFNASKLRSVVGEMPEVFSVVAALGSCCTRKSTILNSLFRSSFATGSSIAKQTTFGIQASAVKGKDLMILTTPPRGLIVLDVEGADSRDQSRAQSQQVMSNFAFGIADVTILLLNMKDIGRVESSGISSFFQTVEENLQLRSERLLRGSKKQLLITVVPDFDKEDFSREDTIAAIMRDYKTALSATARPTGYVGTRITDLFEFEFVTLPNKTLFPEEYENEAKEFRSRLLEPTVDEYLFDKKEFANKYSSQEFIQEASKLWNVLNQRAKTNAAPYEEVNATFRCDLHMKEALRQYQVVGNRWKAEVATGSLIRNFGTESENLVNEMVKVYENLAEDFRGTKAFQRKEEELRENILNDLNVLYTKQLVRVRNLAYENFKNGLNRTPVTSRLEKTVEEKIKIAEKKFLTQAEAMKCKGARWRYETERGDFLKAMREVATERLQMARLQGSYVPGLRSPVNVTLHYLNPNVRPEDFLPSSIAGDRPERMITVPQKVRRDRSDKADPGRLYAHQESTFGTGGYGTTGGFNFGAPF